MSKGKLKFKTLDIIFVVGAIVASILVLVFIKDGTNRFTFIMPIFAGLIFYFILTLEDDVAEGPLRKSPKANLAFSGQSEASEPRPKGREKGDKD